MRFENAQNCRFHNLMLKLMVNPTSMTPNFDLINVVNSTINRRYKHGDSFFLLIDTRCPRLDKSNEGDACN